MDRIKTKRGVKRAQNTKIINEATAGIETADRATLTAWLERLKVNKSALQALNAEIEEHVPEQDLVAEYTTVTEYDDEAIRVIALLGCKADTLKQKEKNDRDCPDDHICDRTCYSHDGSSGLSRILNPPRAVNQVLFRARQKNRKMSEYHKDELRKYSTKNLKSEPVAATRKNHRNSVFCQKNRS
ncbi:hypothetical protein HPB47_022296 [Ixodes persulcatus]|uniref:Uncharacterized protein n=1 Tax=Ixodes persulcatus TaxID=34615 RepID=A0AC60QCI1_IXOPE|nr:hypothetical protein HPB47_022296 [Ixodes persulcatus]